MKFGDISNSVAPTILIRVEDTLFTVTHKTYLGVYTKETITLNENALILIKKLILQSPYRVELVTECKNHSKFNKLIEEYHIPVANVSQYSEQTITNFLNCGIYFCYIDNNLDRIVRVNHKSCYSLSDFSNLVF